MAVEITWVGHATVLVAVDGVRLLTDPVLRPRVLHLRRTAPVPPGTTRGIDAVLLSHGHWDHLDLPSLDRLGKDLPVVAARGLGGLLRRRRFAHVVELATGEEAAVASVTVRATPAEHAGGGRGLFGATAVPVGFLVSGSQRIYFAGDTDLFADMAELAPLDLALLPVWGWGAKLGPGHLDPQRAAEALILLRPRVAVPIHWGTLAPIGRAPLSEPPREFARAAARLAPEVDVRLLEPGASTTVV